MPHFFFHLHTNAGVERDEMGLDLDGLEAAYLEAHEAVPSIAAEFRDKGQNPLSYEFEIADADGRRLMEVPFREVLTSAARPRRH